MLGVNNNHIMKGKRQSKRNQKNIKVTYISSPMKVKTSASNFRALVQELTGQDSNVAEMFVEVNNDVEADQIQKGSSNQQGSSATEAFNLPDSTNCFNKPDYYNELLSSRFSMEPFNVGSLQYELLSFDLL